MLDRVGRSTVEVVLTVDIAMVLLARKIRRDNDSIELLAQLGGKLLDNVFVYFGRHAWRVVPHESVPTHGDYMFKPSVLSVHNAISRYTGRTWMRRRWRRRYGETQTHDES